MKRLLPLLCLAPLWLSCGGSPLDAIEVRSASISHVNWTGIAVVAGVSTTDGVLDIVDTNGNAHSFNIQISGPTLGFIFDVSANDNDPNPVILKSSASLILPEGKTLKASDLSGSYFGNKESAHLVIGGESHDLSNSAGVRLKGSALSIGVGVFVGFEWLSLSVK